MELASKKFFFIGVGGSGMSSLAHILLDMGAKVWGVDLKKSHAIRNLQARGLIFENDLEKLKGVNFNYVIYSSAINRQENIYYQYFLNSSSTLLHRSELMHKIFSYKKSIAVAGSHGKTTTTAMIASILFHSGFDPAIMVGGDMLELGDKGGYFGKGEWGVYESDESDGTFLNHASEIQVLTNIDNDHLDYYKTIENLHDSFYKFLNLSATSKRIVFLDDDGIQNVIKKFSDLENFFCITSNPENKGKNYIPYFIKNGKLFFTKDSQNFELVTPYQGKHYLTNALCATLACLEVGIPISKSLEILKTYRGVRRRLEYLGSWGNVRVYDDYGHHPTEIEAVLSSLNSMKTKASQKVLVLFQPHRYTRTREHYLDFAKVLSKTDICCLLPIYSAGEPPIEGINSELIYKHLTNKESTLLLSGEKEKDIPKLQSLLNQDDLLVCLGAGNVREWGELLIQSHILSFSDK